eukprot:g5179.t1
MVNRRYNGEHTLLNGKTGMRKVVSARRKLATSQVKGEVKRFKKVIRTTRFKKRWPVQCVETGEMYPSVLAAARALGVKQPTMSRALSRGYNVVGKRWTYVKLDEDGETPTIPAVATE